MMGSEQQRLIRTLSSVLERLLSPVVEGDGGDFCAATKPAIPLRQYLERITKYAPFADEILLIAIIYIDRFQQKGKNIVLNHFNIHRLLLTSILVAVKFYSDVFYSNSYFARVGGLACPEMNQLERVFLSAVQFDLIVHDDEFQLYHNEIRRHMSEETEEVTPSVFGAPAALSQPRSSSWAPTTSRQPGPTLSQRHPTRGTSMTQAGLSSQAYLPPYQYSCMDNSSHLHSGWRSAATSPIPASAYSPYASCKSSSTENLQRILDIYATPSH